MPEELDITGMKFNKLTAIKFSHKDKNRQHHWLFKCDCGKQKIIPKNGKSHNIKEWADILNIKYHTLKNQVRAGKFKND